MNLTRLWPAVVFGVFLSLDAAGQTADCLAAEVNGQAITLSDLRIILAFGLEETDPESPEPKTPALVLDRLIDRKVVLELAQENVPVRPEEADAFLGARVRALGREEALKRLAEFGLEWSDLRAYIEEKIVFDKIISMRFSQAAVVSLKEMEDYYERTYLPAQRKLDNPPRPMMQVLGEIEQGIRAEKTMSRVKDWISGLRKQAEIRVHTDCLKKP